MKMKLDEFQKIKDRLKGIEKKLLVVIEENNKLRDENKLLRLNQSLSIDAIAWDSEEGGTCLHDNCPSCGGTGVKSDGTGACVHMISCPCPKCSPK